MQNQDAHFMQQAIQQAKKSAGEGGVPVGACLIHNGVVVASATITANKKNQLFCMAKWIASEKPGCLAAGRSARCTPV